MKKIEGDISQVLQALSNELKPLNTSEDLVSLGLFNNVRTMANRRSAGHKPDYVKVKGHGVLYPRESVIDWFKKDFVFVEQVR